jgi:hypothetical protein
VARLGSGSAALSPPAWGVGKGDEPQASRTRSNLGGSTDRPRR